MSMMIPDYALVAEVMLFSEGFNDAKNLSRKMVKLYKLASEQLSQQVREGGKCYGPVVRIFFCLPASCLSACLCCPLNHHSFPSPTLTLSLPPLFIPVGPL